MQVRSVIIAVLLGLTGGASVIAQELPDVAIYRAMLDGNKATGWVAFRDYDGRQLVYFAPLLTLHCRLSEIRYSINSDALDQTFPVPECIPALPWSLSSDITPEELLLDLPPGSAESLTAQVVWDNGKESEAVTFTPCPGVGDQTCALMAD
jgi:hypothetical protein